ncbi:MAG TPA: hypothetical protein DEB10_08945, partial [Ruminococcaceae bacterium]|nr:hypothetical protein [Oscillospiraceae bacterium]
TSGETDLNGIEASNIELKLTSGSLNASGLKAENISATMTSGNIDASDIQAEDLAIKVTSGKAELSGAFTRIESGLTSGKIIIHSNIASESIESKITSGKTFITIPENDGFVLIVKKTSGDIDCDDFDLKTSLRKSNDEYTYKTGSASGRKYYAKMTSGDFKLRKAK